MRPTEISLIEQLGRGSDAAWRKADELYRPMIADWLGRFGLQESDRDDLTQDVMLTLNRRVATFDHHGRLGAFRAWLKTITVNRAREFYRRGKAQPRAEGGTAFQSMLEELCVNDSAISQQFDRAHDAFLIEHMLREIATEFDEATIRVFQQHVVQGEDAATVAEAAGISRWSVYQAKSRVLRRLRERMGPWAAEMHFG